MDISTGGKDVEQREDEGTTIHVRDEVNEKMYQEGDAKRPVVITVVGTYSSTYRRMAEAQRDRNIKRRSFNLDGDQVEQQALEMVAGCILGFDGFTNAGAPVPFNRANVVAILRAYPWIRQQVETAMNDHAAFFPKPSPSSVSA